MTEMEIENKSVGHSVWKANGSECQRTPFVSLKKGPSHLHTNGSLVIWYPSDAKGIVKAYGKTFVSFVKEKMGDVQYIPAGGDDLLVDEYLELAGTLFM
jgi:hypothetical protein